MSKRWKRAMVKSPEEKILELVLINVTKALVRGKMISDKQGDRKLIGFKYEKMANFYYVCGILNHPESECHVAVKDMKEGRKENYQGIWPLVKS